MTDRESLFEEGSSLLKQFCKLNRLDVPEVRKWHVDSWRFQGTCAYYRPTYIAICVDRCARLGLGGRAWSWPGYVIDRTPYGVLQHELGHHIDIMMSGMKEGYQGTYSISLRKQTKELPITGYTPNDAEWFAEIFRLFVTNPDLLDRCRPQTFAVLEKQFTLSTDKRWDQVLRSMDAPKRITDMAKKKMAPKGLFDV